MRRYFIILFSCAVVSVAAGVAQGPAAPTDQPAVVVVISDLHMGGGERAIGHYFPQEDFRWGQDFVSFLDGLHRAGGGKVWLIVAGDMFELWESYGANDCVADAPDYGCSEDEAVTRMARIASAHRVELQALGAFASRGTSNRVIIIPGNHDAALTYPRVWDVVKSAARPERPERFILQADGRWISPAAKIVVEHGHQIDHANTFPHWPRPMVQAPSGVMRLESPFGEELVRKFFDPIEQRYEAVDNISGGSGLLYGVRAAGITGGAKTFTEFLRLLTLDVSARQFGEFLSADAGSPPKWDAAAIRAAPVEFLTNGIPPDDPSAAVVREILASPSPELLSAATASIATMTDDDIKAICQSRYAINLRQEKEGVAPAQRQSLCPTEPGGDLGYLRDKAVTTVRGELYFVNRYLDSVISQLPSVKGTDTPVTFVYGHTHGATRAVPAANARFKIINTGTWQRIVSGKTIADRARKSGWAANQVMDKVQLAELPQCYSFVWIPFSLGGKSKSLDPKLRYWMLDGDAWKFATDCPEREQLPSD
jgi:UDP-2,3-diacylglucosamine pyrophosphatase LpxH